MLTLAGFSKQMVTIPRAEEPGLIRELSDEALIRAIADGDRRALQALYLRHKVRTYRFVLRLTADAALAEDIVSEVFLDVWRQAVGFKGKSRVSDVDIGYRPVQSALGLARPFGRTTRRLHSDCDRRSRRRSRHDGRATGPEQDRAQVPIAAFDDASGDARPVSTIRRNGWRRLPDNWGALRDREDPPVYARKRVEKLLETAGIHRH